jgi:hypothetical protein
MNYQIILNLQLLDSLFRTFQIIWIFKRMTENYVKENLIL